MLKFVNIILTLKEFYKTLTFLLFLWISYLQGFCKYLIYNEKLHIRHIHHDLHKLLILLVFIFLVALKSYEYENQPFSKPYFYPLFLVIFMLIG